MNRFSKLILLLIVFISSFSMVQAQRGGGRNANPEAAAERQTKVMVDSLGLSEAQAAKVGAVNLDYNKRMTEVRMKMRENTEGDWETQRANMRATMQKMQDEKNLELKKYLTADQFTKMEKMEADRKNRRGNGQGRRGWKGKKDRKGKGKRKAKSEENS